MVVGAVPVRQPLGPANAEWLTFDKRSVPEGGAVFNGNASGRAVIPSHRPFGSRGPDPDPNGDGDGGFGMDIILQDDTSSSHAVPGVVVKRWRLDCAGATGSPRGAVGPHPCPTCSTAVLLFANEWYRAWDGGYCRPDDGGCRATAVLRAMMHGPKRVAEYTLHGPLGLRWPRPNEECN